LNPFPVELLSCDGPPELAIVSRLRNAAVVLTKEDRTMLFKMLGCSGAFVLSVSALAQTRPDIEADANHCELYVDDFAVVQMPGRSTHHLPLVATLKTRPQDVVVGVGVFMSTVQAFIAQLVPATIAGDDRWKVTFDPGLDAPLGGEEEKGVSFAYFVDLRDGALFKRLWLRAGHRNFTLADFDSARWLFSDPVRLNGEDEFRYLWRDGGSPLFAARTSCAY
jgi:hypothetical protein